MLDGTTKALTNVRSVLGLKKKIIYIDKLDEYSLSCKTESSIN